MASNFCAIDFGTSNSALVVAGRPGPTELEDGQTSMPTAVFYFTDADEAVEAGALTAPGALPRAYGRAAVRAYVQGHGGRLMRSLKSILGSALAEQTTELGDGHGVRYRDVVVGYLRHLRKLGEAAQGGVAIERVMLGRPVFFVDDDAKRDALAQSTLEAAAHAAGFREAQFQFEPIAAAFDYEQQATSEQRVLVCDIGGGTSDFSVVRVGPARRLRADRRDDILASHGVHVAGTDFDRRIELDAVLPLAGFRGRGPEIDGRPSREVPSAIYFDLATWHLINTCYRPQRVAELRGMRDFYADAVQHRRLMRVLERRFGHDLAARSEAAKIEAASGTPAQIDLGAIEAGLAIVLDQTEAMLAIEADLQRIVGAALETVKRAGVAPHRIDALYFTGGSTGLAPLTARIAAAFAPARPIQGERLASVVTGLGLHAGRVFG